MTTRAERGGLSEADYQDVIRRLATERRARHCGGKIAGRDCNLCGSIDWVSGRDKQNKPTKKVAHRSKTPTHRVSDAEYFARKAAESLGLAEASSIDATFRNRNPWNGDRSW